VIGSVADCPMPWPNNSARLFPTVCWAPDRADDSLPMRCGLVVFNEYQSA
jgi:hypothetical protein